MSDITEKLRTEINIGKKHRHEFVMRKFSTTTVLLGAGSVKTYFSESAAGVDFTLLLFLVPLVALAFDMYILAEDYRIKRAGGFIRAKREFAADGEGDWEDYCKDNSNVLAVVPSSFVTSILLLISSFLLFQAGYETSLMLWFALVLVTLVALQFTGKKMNKSFKIRANNDA